LPIVGVQLVGKRFGPVIAVDKVSFEVNGGEMFGLLSHNGAGKTTIIRLVLDIFQVESFEIAMPTLDEIFSRLSRSQPRANE
jgi:ABC-type uncharacterized transport system ATPase subunit